MAGPIASAVTNKFGCRRATMFGTVLAASGFIASYFATSLDYLILSLGIVSGFGFSLIYMSAIVVVAFYCKCSLLRSFHSSFVFLASPLPSSYSSVLPLSFYFPHIFSPPPPHTTSDL